MWKFTFCPHFQFMTFTFILIVIELVVFIAEAVHSEIDSDKLSKYNFLGAELKTHQSFGMRMPYFIRYNWHLHRLLLPFFLHYSFSHIVISCLIQMLIGFNFEKLLGSGRLIAFWFASVIGANLFGSICTDKYSIGSEGYVFAMIGGMIGIVFVMLCRPDNLPEEQRERARCSKIMVVFLMVFILLLAAFMMATAF